MNWMAECWKIKFDSFVDTRIEFNCVKLFNSFRSIALNIYYWVLGDTGADRGDRLTMECIEGLSADAMQWNRCYQDVCFEFFRFVCKCKMHIWFIADSLLTITVNNYNRSRTSQAKNSWKNKKKIKQKPKEEFEWPWLSYSQNNEFPNYN